MQPWHVVVLLLCPLFVTAIVAVLAWLVIYLIRRSKQPPAPPYEREQGQAPYPPHHMPSGPSEERGDGATDSGDGPDDGSDDRGR
ncbi:hypothetical protein [Glycomyces tarimensis]